jgi:putative DNA methylase
VTYRKKLIEVALPLEAINVASAREKSIRHGHPSTLHLWWARRPLAACRAVLFASLVDDPDSDPTFRKADGSVDEERAGYRRAELFNLIEELVQWENSNNESVINRARAEIAASVASRMIYDTKEWKKDRAICNEKAWAFVCRTAKPSNVNAFLAEYAPPVLDPFAGGGSIPLEAQRLGLRAFASDLNPVPVLINKALIEIPSKFANMPPVNPDSRGEAGPAGKKGKGKGKSVTGQSEWRGAQGLADDVRHYGNWMRDEAEARVGHLYPKVKVDARMANDRPDLKPFIGEELTVIATIWARTIASPDPSAGQAHVPLVRSFWLSTKKSKERWIDIEINRSKNTYTFRTAVGGAARTDGPPDGLVARTGAICLLTRSHIPFSYIRDEAKAGRMRRRLMAVVAEGPKGRVYLSPTPEQEHLAHVNIPWRPTNAICHWPGRTNVVVYGMDTFDKLFTDRQLATLTTLVDLIGAVRDRVKSDAAQTSISVSAQSDYADAIGTYLAFAIDKGANYWSSVCSWHSDRDTITSTFGRQSIPMTWDFAEANPFSESTGNFLSGVDQAARSLLGAPCGTVGIVEQADAALGPAMRQPYVFSTDPPYYDNIAYADISDFFYVWLRASLRSVYPQLLSTLATPKANEMIASPYRFDGDATKARDFFEAGLQATFSQIRALQQEGYPATVFYAFKQAETDEEEGDSESATASTGWETMLEGLTRADLLITGTWPMRTELTGNLKKKFAALASSVVLVCRARASDAPLATRREFLNALKRELPEALKHLQRGSIAPVDLAQAAIGPGMAVFTRYAKVIEADGSQMKVRQALALVNQMLDEVLAEQEGEFDGDTRWALAWFEQFAMDDGPFGVAETLSKAKNTAVNGLVDAGIIAARSGKVRLLKREELPVGWNPATDNKVRHWEVAQHLIRALETGGETAAADLLRKVGGMGEVARDLAYRLYNLCERKKWASEALAYNGLVIAWPEITKLARSAPVSTTETQTEMFGGGR